MDYESLVETVIDNGYLPTFMLRRGIRAQLRGRIDAIASTSVQTAQERKMAYVEQLRTRPIALHTADANEQHYEVGTGVLAACLGPRLKYSCCLYPRGVETLDQAELAMLEMYVERAELRDGMRIFDLGCGWGSLSLYLAEIFPNSEITAFSNSRTQKEHIDARARERGLSNVSVVTGDIATTRFDGTAHEGAYDRVLSIELFEHMKNYEKLLGKVSGLLKSSNGSGGGGKLFVHIFAHRSTPYDFETGAGWMARHFFTGGTMPSADLLLYFQRDLRIARHWWLSGRHYAATCEAWYAKLTAARAEVWPHLVETYGADAAAAWFHRWQVFYLACAELFAWNNGEEWGVCHYLFEKPE